MIPASLLDRFREAFLIDPERVRGLLLTPEELDLYRYIQAVGETDSARLSILRRCSAQTYSGHLYNMVKKGYLIRRQIKNASNPGGRMYVYTIKPPTTGGAS